MGEGNTHILMPVSPLADARADPSFSCEISFWTTVVEVDVGSGKEPRPEFTCCILNPLHNLGQVTTVSSSRNQGILVLSPGSYERRSETREPRHTVGPHCSLPGRGPQAPLLICLLNDC